MNLKNTKLSKTTTLKNDYSEDTDGIIDDNNYDDTKEHKNEYTDEEKIDDTSDDSCVDLSYSLNINEKKYCESLNESENMDNESENIDNESDNMDNESENIDNESENMDIESENVDNESENMENESQNMDNDIKNMDNESENKDNESENTENESVNESEITYNEDNEENQDNDVDLNYEDIPTQNDILTNKYSSRMMRLIKINDHETLVKNCNRKVFEKINTIYNKNANENNIVPNMMERRYRRKQAVQKNKPKKILKKLIKNIMSKYYNNCIVKNTGNILSGTRVCIYMIIIDYYDVVGKSSMLINELIRCRMWPILDMINQRTLIKSKEINLLNISDDQMNELKNINVKIKYDETYIFNKQSFEQIKEYLKQKYLDYVPLNIFNKIKDEKIIKYLCEEKKILLTRKSIRYYHQECYLELINYLMEKDLIKIKNSDILCIFKSKNRDKKVYNNGRVFAPRKIYRHRNYNDNAISIGFENSIDKYIKNVQSKGFNIPMKSYTISVFMQNRKYDLLIDLIGIIDEKFKIEKWSKLQLFVHCAKNDDLDRFKILLNKKIIMINELHQKSRYITNSIKLNAFKIVKYIVNELKVKFIFTSLHQISNSYWRKGSESVEIIKTKLKFLKEIEVQFPKILIVNALLHSVDLVEVLINEFDIKIEKNQLKYLKSVGINKFKQYTKDVKFNKKIYIKKLINLYNPREGVYYGRNYRWNRRINTNSKNKKYSRLAINLLSTLPDKLIYAQKCAIFAINCGNGIALDLINKKYEIKYDMEQIKTSIKSLKNTHAVISILENLSKYYPEELVRNLITAEEFEKKLCKNIDDYYNIDFDKIVKFKIQLSVVFLEKIITCSDYVLNHEDKNETVIAIVTTNERYINNDLEYDKEVYGLLCKSSIFADIFFIINNEQHNFVKYLTKQSLHDMFLNTIASGYGIENMIAMIEKHFVHLLTPYVYTIINIGMNARKNNYDLWKYNVLSYESVIKILKMYGHITKADFNEIFNVKYNLSKNQITEMENTFQILDNYQEVPEDIPENYKFYEDMANINIVDGNFPRIDNDAKNDTLDIMNEVDQALNDALVNIDIEYPYNLDNIDDVENENENENENEIENMNEKENVDDTCDNLSNDNHSNDNHSNDNQDKDLEQQKKDNDVEKYKIIRQF